MQDLVPLMELLQSENKIYKIILNCEVSSFSRLLVIQNILLPKCFRSIVHNINHYAGRRYIRYGCGECVVMMRRLTSGERCCASSYLNFTFNIINFFLLIYTYLHLYIDFIMSVIT
jgi:hypothetical protein